MLVIYVAYFTPSECRCNYSNSDDSALFHSTFPLAVHSNSVQRSDAYRVNRRFSSVSLVNAKNASDGNHSKNASRSHSSTVDDVYNVTRDDSATDETDNNRTIDAGVSSVTAAAADLPGPRGEIVTGVPTLLTESEGKVVRCKSVLGLGL